MSSPVLDPSADPWRPLDGLRVLELQRTAMAAYAGRLFREYGAEVVLLEDPDAVAEVRAAGPFVPGDADPNGGGLHRYLNAGKLGVAVRDAHPDGRALVQRLAAKADLVIHEYPGDGAAERGLTYAALRAGAPGVVVLGLTPFGADGPYAHWKATENILFALSGRMYIQGQPDRSPLAFAPGAVACQVAATAAGAAIAALWAASEQGEGREVEVSGLEAQLASVDNLLLMWTMGGYETPRGFYPPYTYPTADGNVLLGAVGPKYVGGMAAALGRPDLATDPRFASPVALAEHQLEFDEIVLPFFLGHSRHAVVERMQAHGVMCAPVEPPADVLNNPQYSARGFFQPLDAESAEFNVAGPSFRLQQDVLPPVPAGAPALGQHSGEVLSRWLGLSAAEVSQLALLGAVR